MKIRRILKLVWDEFVYGGHLASVAAASAVFSSALLLDINITWDCLLLIYLGTYVIYSYNRFREFGKDSLTNPLRTEHIRRYVKYIPLIDFLAIIIAISTLLYFGKLPALFFWLFLLFVGIFYSVFLKKITKTLVAFKSFVIASVYVLLVVFLSIYYSFSPNLPFFLVLIFVYLRLFMITVFFDIKDVDSDKKEGLRTLPIILGQKRIVDFLIVLNIVSAFPIVVGLYFHILPVASLMLLIVIPYALYYFSKLQKKRESADALSYVYSDGEPILWPVAIFLGRILL